MNWDGKSKRESLLHKSDNIPLSCLKNAVDNGLKRNERRILSLLCRRLSS